MINDILDGVLYVLYFNVTFN